MTIVAVGCFNRDGSLHGLWYFGLCFGKRVVTGHRTSLIGLMSVQLVVSWVM